MAIVRTGPFCISMPISLRLLMESSDTNFHDDLDWIRGQDPTSWEIIIEDWESDASATVKAQFCLAEQFPPACSVQLSIGLMVLVIICNAVKASCILATATRREFKPLVTIGDSIESFMEDPDPTTAKQGTLSKVDVCRRAWHPGYAAVGPRGWQSRRRFWFSAASLRRWLCTITLYFYSCPLELQIH